MPDAQYKSIHIWGFAGAVFFGSLIGGSLDVLWFLCILGRTFGFGEVLHNYFGYSILFFSLQCLTWMFGLLIFGMPCWRLLRKRGFQGWRAAALLGVTLTFVVSLALRAGLPIFANHLLTPPEWWAAAHQSLISGLFGLVVALVIWRIAYRRSIS